MTQDYNNNRADYINNNVINYNGNYKKAVTEVELHNKVQSELDRVSVEHRYKR